MLFNSFEFLFFLPVVFIGYWFVFRRLRIQNLFVVIMSYLFYGWWDWRFLFLIFLTTLLCFSAGILIESAKKRMIRRFVCGLNITLNIGLLCYFKYFNFFAENLNILFSQFGYSLDWFTIDVLLPVGISFYTFQAISYPIDVYRKKINATKDFVAFTAFISFFPQLVAGPIERSTNLLPQFVRKREFDYGTSVDGMRQILWGFFKKIVVADNCAMLANAVFADYASCSAPALVLGAIFFTFQIYGDFSGYSDIAIGVAKLFGIRLCANFHYPYFSRDIAEFWRRWHISLNTWFRDYIYIPLGGSRCSKIKIVRNTMVIFLLSGLWHGANWTFIAWGAFHGILFLPLILTGRNKRNTNSAGPRDVMSILLTFILVTVGWVVFRSETLSDAMSYLSMMLTDWGRTDISIFAGNWSVFASTMVMIVALTATDWCGRKKVFGLQIVEGKPVVVRWGIYISLMFAVLIFAGQQEQFIYFQF